MWTGLKKEAFELLARYEKDNDFNNYKKEEFDPLIREQFKEIKSFLYPLLLKILPEYDLTDKYALSKHASRGNTLYHHFWGAIYRASKENKSKDIQLFWRIDPTRFSFGLYFGFDVEKELLQSCQANIDNNREQILSAFKSINSPRKLLCKIDDTHGFSQGMLSPDEAFAPNALINNSGINIYFNYELADAVEKGVKLREEIIEGFSKIADLYRLIVGTTNKTKYWGGGIGNKGDLEKWIKGNYWQVNFSKDSDKPAAITAWESFGNISVDDEFVIRGVGGKNWDDLVCHYYGKVIKKNVDSGTLYFEELKREKYSGKKPKGAGAGNWGITINQVTRKEDIDLIFFNKKGHTAVNTPSKNENDSPILGPKNRIYYGPPGTGKTMTVLNLREQYTTRGSIDNQDELIAKVVKSLSWWECIACVLADVGGWVKVVDIKEHPIIKAKIEMQNNKSINNTLWGQLQNHTAPGNKYVNTREDKRMEPFIFEKNENSQWSLVQEWKEMVPDISETVEKISKGQSEGEGEERFKLVTFHPNFTYEDFILGIRPDTDDAEGIRYEKVPGKFKEICDMARKHQDKSFAIFIDEINRGNIPAIFGELITLIEEDKRGILIDIPNSDEKFSVPDNLWIYGTMNTADRSVESLDIALRRRFSFVPIYPNPGVLENKMIGNINLQSLLRTINDRIEFLKDKDHTIGHSYFLKVNNYEDLKVCFSNRILPLLEEYFYNDYEKIGLILGSSFVKKNDQHKNTKTFFASFDSDLKDDLDEYDVYYIELMDKITEEDFISIYETK